MKNRLLNCLAATAFTVLFAGPSLGATVTFDSFATNTDNPVIDTVPLVSVNDDTAGLLTFSITTPNANGLLSGIYLDFAGDPSFASTDLSSLTAGVDIVDFAQDTNDIGNGRNLNGNFGAPISGPSGIFDIGFGFDDGDNGGGGRQIVLPFEFSLGNLGSLTLASLERVGLRFQSVGGLGVNGLGGGSERLISVPPGTVSPVPLPAAFPLMAGGLAIMGLLGWRRKRQTA